MEVHVFDTEYNQGVINGEEGMHRTYTAKLKNGGINSSFLIRTSTTIHAHVPYTLLAQLPCFCCNLLGVRNAWSLNFAYPARCFLNFAVSYSVRAVHALFPVYKPLV